MCVILVAFASKVVLWCMSLSFSNMQCVWNENELINQFSISVMSQFGRPTINRGIDRTSREKEWKRRSLEFINRATFNRTKVSTEGPNWKIAKLQVTHKSTKEPVGARRFGSAKWLQLTKEQATHKKKQAITQERIYIVWQNMPTSKDKRTLNLYSTLLV